MELHSARQKVYMLLRTESLIRFRGTRSLLMQWMQVSRPTSMHSLRWTFCGPDTLWALVKAAFRISSMSSTLAACLIPMIERGNCQAGLPDYVQVLGVARGEHKLQQQGTEAVELAGKVGVVLVRQFRQGLAAFWSASRLPDRILHTTVVWTGLDCMSFTTSSSHSTQMLSTIMILGKSSCHRTQDS